MSKNVSTNIDFSQISMSLTIMLSPSNWSWSRSCSLLFLAVGYTKAKFRTNSALLELKWSCAWQKISFSRYVKKVSYQGKLKEGVGGGTIQPSSPPLQRSVNTPHLYELCPPWKFLFVGWLKFRFWLRYKNILILHTWQLL